MLYETARKCNSVILIKRLGKHTPKKICASLNAEVTSNRKLKRNRHWFGTFESTKEHENIMKMIQKKATKLQSNYNQHCFTLVTLSLQLKFGPYLIHLTIKTQNPEDTRQRIYRT